MFLRILNFAPTLCLIVSVFIFSPIISNFYLYWDCILAPAPTNHEVFDFIVIGSGSAGAVVANRLSKNSKVLLLEAGGDPVPYVSIPLLAPELMHFPTMNWNHKTIPQKYSSFAMSNKTSLWPRGKMLGGTSNLNYMYYVRGNPLDFDNWANITGDEEWKYENVLPYFKKSLDYQGAFKDNEKHYGETPYGYLHVEKRKWAPFHEIFINGVNELGYEEIDLNGPQRVGFGHSEVSQKFGRRSGTFAAFLKNFQNRQNLRISRYSHATKIKLDSNNRAEGVWYIRHGKKYFARASKEVILSAGSVDSPKLLMLSGIGPKNHLKSLKIKTKVNLPVGQNLKDHLALPVFPFIIDQPISIILTRDFGIQAIYDYFVNGYGPWTTPVILHSHGFISSKFSSNADWPDLQVYISAGGVYPESASDLSRIIGLNLTTISEFLSPLSGQEYDGFSFMPTLVRPRSIGEITLRDKNPLSPPLIDPRYLEDSHDVKTLIEGIKFSIKLGEETKAFKNLNAKLWDLTFPGCEKHEPRTDAYWTCYVRHVAFSLYHPVGTCRMGKVGDPKAVVDSKLRVLHTTGLRVADASIMPEIVNGNTNAPTIMIGERVADLVREYWSQQFLISPKILYLTSTFIKYEKCHYSRLV